MKKIAFLILSVLLFGNASAQQVRPMSSAEIYQKLGQLNTLGTAMYFAAHPDDENTRLISYLVHHEHIRTVYYSLTRGDGGQNIIGNEQGPALGLIRTYELLEARKLDGAEQLFSPFIDFGYTSSVPETFTFWNKEKLVKDAVQAIQEVKPDVIICRFPTTGEGGHGHHTASAIVAEEAWNYIKKHNETAKDKLWLPERILFNAFQFGSRSTIRPGQFKIQINQYNPLLGEGLGELAGRSRSEHKSQGAGTPQIVGKTKEHFQLLGGPKMETGLFDGIDLSWNRVAQPEIGKAVQKIIDNFNFTHPDYSIPDLIQVKKKILKMEDSYWKTQKLKEINHIIISCSGIMAEALTPNSTATPGESLSLKLNLISRGKHPVSLKKIESTRAIKHAIKGNLKLSEDSLHSMEIGLTLNENEPLTQPYWMMETIIKNEYQFPAQYLGMPIAENDLSLNLSLDIEGMDFHLQVPISYKKLDPVRGDVTQRLRVVPLVSIEPVNNLLIFETDKNANIDFQIKVFSNIETAYLVAQVGNYEQKTALKNLAKGNDTFISISLSGKELAKNISAKDARFYIEINGQKFDKAQHLIDYPHIPELQYFTPATMKLIQKDWKVSAKKIGYVEGVGDYVDDILKLTGLSVEIIPPSELNNQNYLKQFDAVIVGIRALNTHKHMIAGMDGLLQYTKSGGTLIMQYNTSMQLISDKFGPYPITLSRDRVTDETAAIRFTNPKSPLLNYPNKIRQKDFDDWVQERGLYFPGKWDSQYQTIFSTNDKGQKALESATLYTPYGKGHYIYTSFAFFRQLPAGNPGAIRLLMNFLSVGRE